MEQEYTIQQLNAKLVSSIVEFLNRDGEITGPEDILMVEELGHPDFQFFRGLHEIGFYEMSHIEQVVLLIYCDQFVSHGPEPLLFGDVSSQKHRDELIRGKNCLMEKGIVEGASLDANCGDRSDSRRERSILAADICGKLFYGMKDLIPYSSLTKQVEVIKSTSILKRDLFFDEKDISNVARVRKLLDPKTYRDVMTRLNSRGHRNAVMCLFYGAPGTGKTELAKQFARETGRDIFIADPAKLNASFHGDSEKNYRQLFRNYRYFAKISPEAPILLLNEADALLGKRLTEIRQAVDTILNNVQNILLQELEDFEGILIATTNLTEGLDAAYARRFLFKVIFHKPSVSVREKIWRSVVPELSQYEATTLARAYDFSGAQIANVAIKRDIDEVLDGETPDLKKMMYYCETEQFASEDESKRPTIFYVQVHEQVYKC